MSNYEAVLLSARQLARSSQLALIRELTMSMIASETDINALRYLEDFLVQLTEHTSSKRGDLLFKACNIDMSRFS
jgi:hypothetical protein